MSIRNKWDNYSDPLEAREASNRASASVLKNQRPFSKNQTGTVYSRPVPLNSDDAAFLMRTVRSKGVINQNNLKDVFRFKVKFDPEPGRTYAVDDALEESYTIPNSYTPVEAALAVSLLPEAISLKGYSGKVPKIGDKVECECFYAIDQAGQPSLEVVIFKEISEDRIALTSLSSPDNVEGSLSAKYTGDWSARPRAVPPPAAPAAAPPATPTGSTPAPAASAPPPPPPHPRENNASVISTAAVNNKKVKITWEEAATLYANGLNELLLYASQHEGSPDQIVSHRRSDVWTAGNGSRRISDTLTGYPASHKLTDFTIREIVEDVHPFINKQRSKGKILSTAIGAYQILQSTLCKGTNPGVSGNPANCSPNSALGVLKANHSATEYDAILDTKFNADSQHRLGVILAVGKRPILGNYLFGFHNNYTQAGQHFAFEWASIPLQDTFNYKNRGECHVGQTAYCRNPDGTISTSNRVPRARSGVAGAQEAVDKMDATRAKFSAIAGTTLASFFSSNSATHTRQQTETEKIFAGINFQSINAATQIIVHTATAPDIAVQAALHNAGVPGPGPASAGAGVAVASRTASGAGGGALGMGNSGFMNTALTTDASADIGTKENPGTYGVDWISVASGNGYRQKNLHTDEYWPRDPNDAWEADFNAAFGQQMAGTVTTGSTG